MPRSVSDVSADEVAAIRLPDWFVALIVACLCPLPFWGTLLLGDGLIGGDMYPYFLPQKLYLQESLQHGELPLWHRWTGFGYPALAESQIGLFYPPHLVFYSLFETVPAYNFNQVLHYIATFFCMWLYARRIGITATGSLFAAMIYTYAWFPCRICLEWAIIGGPWLPLALWLLEKQWQTGQWRYGLWLSVAIGTQLLAGHFNLSFLTLLTISVTVPARLWWAREELPERVINARGRYLLGAILAVTCGILLAAVQLVPTLELRERSQRANIGRDFQPGYGNIPAGYLAQIVWPWAWYPRADLDELIPTFPGKVSAATNKVEAQLYWGVIPLGLLLLGLCGRFSHGPRGDRRFLVLGMIGLAALIYTTGWPLLVTRYLPGFSFFTGPGRYGMLTTFAVALWAAKMLDVVWNRFVTNSESRKIIWPAALLVGLAGITFAEYWFASKLVTYGFIVYDPPLKFRDQSVVRKILLEEEAERGPVRLNAPGANLPNLLGVSCLPVYLGLGPAEYFDPFNFRPEKEPDPEGKIAPLWMWGPGDAQLSQRQGVTHFLTFEPFNERVFPVTLLWTGHDELLNRAWGRSEPLWLYRLQGSVGRVYWANAAEPHAGMTSTVHQTANVVQIDLQAEQSGRLVLTDLDYPGWRVFVNGQPAKAEREWIFRAVDVPAGKQTIIWVYRPTSVLVGAGISLLMLFAIAAVGHLRFWHPRWLEEWLERRLAFSAKP